MNSIYKMKKIVVFLFMLIVKMSFAQTNVKTYKYGFINIKTGKEITPLKYDKVFSFKDETAVVKLDGKYGRINKEGKEIVPIKYDFIDNFYQDLDIVMVDKKYGIINSKGKEITRVKYDKVDYHDNGLLTVLIDKKYGIINTEGTEITPIKYDVILIRNNMIIVKNGNKCGALDLNGFEISPFIYEDIKPLSWTDDCLKFYIVRLEKKYGLVNEKFEKITEIKYDNIFFFAGAINVEVNGKYGFLNEQGEETTEIKYERIGYLVNIGKMKLTPAMLANKWSFFNAQGKELFPGRYDSYEDLEFDSDLYKMMKVSNNNKWGCVNENLVEVISPKYNQIDFVELGGDFSNVITAKLNNKWGILDMKGNELIGLECDEIKGMDNGFIFFKRNGKWGVMYSKDKDFLEAKYQEIEFLYRDLFTVKINDKWGVSKGVGQIVIPPIYDERFSYSSKESIITGTLKNEKIVFDEKANIISKDIYMNNDKKWISESRIYCEGYYVDNEYSEKIGEQITSDFIKVKINDNWILTDFEGREVTMPIKNYSKNYYNDDIAIVKVKVD